MFSQKWAESTGNSGNDGRGKHLSVFVTSQEGILIGWSSFEDSFVREDGKIEETISERKGVCSSYP